MNYAGVLERISKRVKKKKGDLTFLTYLNGNLSIDDFKHLMQPK